MKEKNSTIFFLQLFYFHVEMYHDYVKAVKIRKKILNLLILPGPNSFSDKKNYFLS